MAPKYFTWDTAPSSGLQGPHMPVLCEPGWTNIDEFEQLVRLTDAFVYHV
jgi:hypothetical protein